MVFFHSNTLLKTSILAYMIRSLLKCKFVLRTIGTNEVAIICNGSNDNWHEALKILGEEHILY
jgi:hypothetical protein